VAARTRSAPGREGAVPRGRRRLALIDRNGCCSRKGVRTTSPVTPSKRTDRDRGSALSRPCAQARGSRTHSGERVGLQLDRAARRSLTLAPRSRSGSRHSEPHPGHWEISPAGGLAPLSLTNNRLQPPRERGGEGERPSLSTSSIPIIPRPTPVPAEPANPGSERERPLISGAAPVLASLPHSPSGNRAPRRATLPLAPAPG
jgi:hypothetical protein